VTKTAEAPNAAGGTKPAYRTKLIEVALPLEAINVASAREKSIRHGHPSTLHLWWARRPLAACRAVLFSQMVDDPSACPEEYPTKEWQDAARQKLFHIIEELVKWENSNNEAVLMPARREIARSVARGKGLPAPETDEDVWRMLREHAPPVLDPFCGGGSIPLEAQRLGLEAHASDLNPVAVLITKAMIEIPPKFAGMPPVNPEDRARMGSETGWPGATGLAADVRHYGKWMRDEAFKRIGHLYPKVKLPPEQGGGEATVIAWLWTRTVTCPNPACGAWMPLVRSFWLSTKKGKETWVEPVVDREEKKVRFEVRSGSGKAPEGTVNRQGARCMICDTSVPFEHVRSEGRGGRLGQQLMAEVAEGNRARVYVSPSSTHGDRAREVEPTFTPSEPIADNPGHTNVYRYGLTTWGDLFTPRQLVALTTLSDLVSEARERTLTDARTAGLSDDGVLLHEGGSGAVARADAVATYLALSVDKVADYNSSLVSWSQSRDQARSTFTRQALPMVWDFCEVNPFAGAAGDPSTSLDGIAEAVEKLPSAPASDAQEQDAASMSNVGACLVSTDPPYYDNIGYADLSDFFYVWLRRVLASLHPGLFSTLLVPKAQELVATPYRFDGSKQRAKSFFEEGLAKAFARIREACDGQYPVSIYYAFKQAESDEGAGSLVALASTGWETMLEAVLRAGFAIIGTWPVRTERTGRSVSIGANALASSVVLACRLRPIDAPLATLREFDAALRQELPAALRRLQHGNIAPVDLAQAAIGPGMAIFSRYSRVVEADGSAMPVRRALQHINAGLDTVLAEQDQEYDADTRWAIAWFEQYGVTEGPYGAAETLSKAKDTSIGGLVQAGFLSARGGKVRLLAREELIEDWDPAKDKRFTVWELTQHLIRRLDRDGEVSAADLLRRVGALGETAHDLAFRLHLVADRRGWTQEAIAYNSLGAAWAEITRLAGRSVDAGQGALFE
jgi:putative DNA methylase